MNRTQSIIAYIIGLAFAFTAVLPVLAEEQNTPFAIDIVKPAAGKTKITHPSRAGTESQQQENQPVVPTPNNKADTQTAPSDTPYVTYDGAANATTR